MHILPRDKSSRLGCWGPASPVGVGLLVAAPCHLPGLSESLTLLSAGARHLASQLRQPSFLPVV